MDYSALLMQANNMLIYPWVLLIIIPAVPLLWILLQINFVKFVGDDAEPALMRKRNFLRFIVFITRLLAVFALLIAIASPFVEKETVVDGDPFLRIAVDNSTSFGLFDQETVSNAVAELSKKVRAEVTYFGSEDQSPIGDALLSSLQNNGNVLLISDGYTNTGVDLGDVVLYASKLNATINAVDLRPKKNDVRVSINGPSKTLEDVEAKFMIKIDRVGEINEVRLKVNIDGTTVVDKITRDASVIVSQKLSQGYHQITATIEAPKDHFGENNVYYKSVKAVKKPKIFFMTKNDQSPFYTLLSQVYIIEKGASLPKDLEGYSAVIINNLNIKDITEEEVTRLGDYVSEGNGFMVIGGDNSFERGGYKDSQFEALLPVYVAEPGKKEGDTNIVMMIDVSGSQGQSMGNVQALSVSKAQALNVFGDLKPENKLAIVAFNTQGYLVEPLSYISEKVNPTEKLKKLASGGGTMIGNGLFMALDVLKASEGSKNIILISDGITQLPDAAFQTASLASKFGVKIYTVGIGPQTNDYVMQKIAQATGGIYFKTDQSSRLKLLFGKPEQGDKKRFGVSILDGNHFITEELEPPVALINGYNIVVPKTTASQLIATDVGDPLITAWRYGLGRVVAYTTDDGTQFSGELLSKQNSHVLTRATNWVIGDPDRKSEAFVDAEDTRLKKPTKVTVKSPNPPHAEGAVFYKAGTDIYQTTLIPSKSGFNQLIDAIFAVNYPEEYSALGIDPMLEANIHNTGGKFYLASELDKIVEEVKTRSKRTVVKKTFVRYPFILAAIAIFLLEIAVRRLMRIQKK